MPRGQMQTACERCRKNRKKCDGQTRCKSCLELGETCTYKPKQQVSKSDLRAQIERLEKGITERNELIKTLTSNQDLDAYQTKLQGSIHASQSQQHGYGSDEERGDSTTTTLSPTSTNNTRRESVGSSTFDQLSSWRSCRLTSISRDMSGPSNDSTILSLPPLPLDAYIRESSTDTWTQTGWTRAHIRHLFDVLLTWDYLPFSLLRQDEFLQHYHSGSSQFCSPALVHAMLALSSRLINGNDDQSRLLPSGWFGSKVFFEQAVALLEQRGSPSSLPDIQALGILALYELRCGQETEAFQLAETFVARITELCQQPPPKDKEDESVLRVRATTYCGAVSLLRILHLTTGQLFNITEFQQEETVVLDDSTSSGIGGSQGNRVISSAGLGPGSPAEKDQLQDIMLKTFMLTEWVYNLIRSTRVEPTKAARDGAVVYNKCLDWYENLFALHNPSGSRTPFILFAHMYYHFCVLCAFRPFVSLALDVPDIQPRSICIQATQSILALAQSYDDLFTLRRVSGLIPYFICASGLYSLGLEDDGSRTDPVHLRLSEYEPPTKPGPSWYETVVSHDNDSENPSYVTISAVAHARLLLGKISSTHPSVRRAENMLKGGA